MASVAINPTSTNIISVVTACRVTCAAVANNDTTAFDPDDSPTEPELLYYFKASKTGVDPLVSTVFSTNPDGTAEWNDVIFPAAGTWTLGVYRASNDSSVVTASVVVS